MKMKQNTGDPSTTILGRSSFFKSAGKNIAADLITAVDNTQKQEHAREDKWDPEYLRNPGLHPMAQDNVLHSPFQHATRLLFHDPGVITTEHVAHALGVAPIVTHIKGKGHSDAMTALTVALSRPMTRAMLSGIGTVLPQLITRHYADMWTHIYKVLGYHESGLNPDLPNASSTAQGQLQLLKRTRTAADADIAKNPSFKAFAALQILPPAHRVQLQRQLAYIHLIHNEILARWKFDGTHWYPKRSFPRDSFGTDLAATLQTKAYAHNELKGLQLLASAYHLHGGPALSNPTPSLYSSRLPDDQKLLTVVQKL